MFQVLRPRKQETRQGRWREFAAQSDATLSQLAPLAAFLFLPSSSLFPPPPTTFKPTTVACTSHQHPFLSIKQLPASSHLTELLPQNRILGSFLEQLGLCPSKISRLLVSRHPSLAANAQRSPTCDRASKALKGESKRVLRRWRYGSRVISRLSTIFHFARTLR